MRAGTLRHRVTLQRPDVDENDAGAQVDNWVDVATVPANYLELRGSQYLKADEMHHDIVAAVRIRYRADVHNEPEWRLIYQGRPYRIEHVIDMAGKRKELELLVAHVR